MLQYDHEYEQLLTDLRLAYTVFNNLRKSVIEFTKAHKLKTTATSVREMSASDLLKFAAMIKAIREFPLEEDSNAPSKPINS